VAEARFAGLLDHPVWSLPTSMLERTPRSLLRISGFQQLQSPKWLSAATTKDRRRLLMSVANVGDRAERAIGLSCGAIGATAHVVF
jgi:hypothetical protein